VTEDPHPWATSLPSLYDHAWQRLVRGVHDRRAPARHPTLATVSPEGQPQARTVVLRAVDRASGCLTVHTSLHSPKVHDLKRLPVAAVHVWDAGSRLQIRMQADVAIVSGAAAAQAWSKVPERSRAAYTGGQAPGEPIQDALAYTSIPDARAFAMLQLSLQSIDLLHLGPVHRRACFTRDRTWEGQWLVP
jgi:pyridoxamine 5'-phosphate oxidase